MSNYEFLLMDYYQREKELLKEVAALGLEDDRRAVLEASLTQLRHWMVEAFQSQDQRTKELDAALRETRGALLSAQDRMEGMERENAQAAMILFRMRNQEGSSEGLVNPMQDLQRRVEEQESLLRHRESELLALRKQFTDAQKELDAVVERLTVQEQKAASNLPVPEPPPQIILPPIAPQDPGAIGEVSPGEAQELRRRLSDSESRAQQLERELEDLRQARRQIEEARDELARQVQALEADVQARFVQYQAAIDQAQLQRQQVEAVCASLQQQLTEQLTEKERMAEEYKALTNISTGAEGEVQQLRKMLNDAMGQKQQRDSESNALRAQLASLQNEKDKLAVQLKTLEGGRSEVETVSSAVSDDQITRLKKRLAELEAQLKERDPGVEDLRKQLKDAAIFRDGVVQRMQVLEAARNAAVAAATQAEEESAELKQWQIDRQELEERLIIMQRDLANVRRAQENSERDWIETLTRQDTMRLKQISELRTELERLRKISGK